MILGFAAGNSSSTVNNRETTRSTLPSTGTAGKSKAIADYRRGGIVANARQRTQRIQILREVSAVPLDNDLRTSVQIASAGVISEAGPGAQHIVQAGRRQRINRRPSGQESCVVRRDGFDRGLLQHDFGKPDTIRIRAVAAPRAPGQNSGVPVIPSEQIGGLRRPGFLPLRQSGWYGHGADDGKGTSI